MGVKALERRKKEKNERKAKKTARGASHPRGETRELSNWTAGIFQPGYAGRSLHGEQRPL